MTVTDEIKHSSMCGRTAKKYYKGELEVIHGVDEAAEFIAKGKYQETKDQQGDKCYIKVQEFAEESKQRTKTASINGC